MNRRTFFKGLAAAAPALFLPKLIVPVWKAIPKACTPYWGLSYYTLNPAWVNAPYEINMIWAQNSVGIWTTERVQQRVNAPNAIKDLMSDGDSFPLRFAKVGERFEQIPPFIKCHTHPMAAVTV